MKYYIGIDLGGTNVRTLLVDENGESYSEVKGPTECENGPDYVCDKIIKQIILLLVQLVLVEHLLLIKN